MSRILIIDLGSHSVKIGLDEHELPIMVTRPLIYDNCDYLKFDSIIKNGIINNYLLFKKLLQKWLKQLKINPQNFNLFLSVCDTYSESGKLYKFLFDNFTFNNIYIGRQTSLCLYYLGRNTGLLCNIGHDMVQIIPVYYGYFIEHLNKKFFLSGKEIDKQIANRLTHLTRNNYNNLNYNDICLTKKKLSFKNENLDINKTLKLSNNDSIIVSQNLNQTLDVLFNPKKFNLDIFSIVEEINLTIKSSDLTIRSELMNNIIIIGGTTMIDGFEDRINYELKKINHNYGNVIFEKNRQYLEWLGAKSLVKLDIFNKMWHNKSDYIEISKDINSLSKIE